MGCMVVPPFDRWDGLAEPQGCPLLHSDSMKLPATALLLIASCFTLQNNARLVAQPNPKAQTSSTPHRHGTKTTTRGPYLPDFFIDTHADTTQRMLDEHYDLTEPLNGGHVNFEAAQKGKLGAEFFSIWVEPQF
jgi:hypothetical protein